MCIFSNIFSKPTGALCSGPTFFFFIYDPLKYLTELLSNNSHVTGPRPVMHVLWLLVRGSEGSACSSQTMETMAAWFECKVKLL